MHLYVFAFYLAVSSVSSCLDRPPSNEPSIASETPAATIERVSTPDAFQQEMLDRVNALRTAGCRCGNRKMPPVPPLTYNTKLEAAAAAHAQYMQRTGRFDHTGAGGSSVADRASEAGYDWGAIAENIALGQPSIEAVVSSWKNSPGHCQNMMDKAYSQMGVAQEGRYWVQVLAAPR